MSIDLRRQIVGGQLVTPTRFGDRPYINLDNAASTPPLADVMKTVQEMVPVYASVHRGNGYKSRLSTQIYEDAHQQVASFVGANPDEHVVIFGKNTTEAINKLSYRLGLRKRDIVLISHLEHHSNDLPWRARATVQRIRMTVDGDVDRYHFKSLLSQYGSRIKLVAITGASNVTGSMPDVHWFAQHAHQVGAQILVDCAQLAAHQPINMGKLTDARHLDYVALSAHKMYAPFGTGALVGRKDMFMRGEPEYRGGGTVNYVSTKLVDWTLPPDVDEAGSPNVIGAAAMARACQALQAIGMPTIISHEKQVTNYALQQLRTIPGLKLYGHTGPSANRLGVIPFSIAGVPAHLVAAVLGYEWGVGVRSGCFCAQPYVMDLMGLNRVDQHRVRHNILHKRRDKVPGLVRISLGLYNTMADIDWAVHALRSIASGDFGEYQVDAQSGQFTPANIHHSDQLALVSDGALGRLQQPIVPNHIAE